MRSKLTILHLSDLHFGWDGDDPNKIADRTLCLDGFVSTIAVLDHDWKPNVICISGDIGWKGTAKDYEHARAWLERLLSSCKLDFSRLVVFPGNHDVIRPDAEGNARPPEAKEADSVLGLPIREHFQKPFAAFSQFCRTTGIPPMQLNLDSHLVGERQLDGVRFVVLNSAWFSKDDHDKEKLWIGLPHMRFLESKELLKEVHGKTQLPLTVALVHHPSNWLHPHETAVQGLRQNTWDYLARRSHVVLTGHTHGEVRRSDRIAEGAWHFTGGSAYAGASHFNSFRLIRIEEQEITYRSFEFDPRAVEDPWHSGDAVRLQLLSQPQTQSAKQDPRESYTIERLRSALMSHAEWFVQQKSRLLRPIGPIPNTVSQPLLVRVSNLSERFDATGRLLRAQHNEQPMSSYEATRRNRCTLILGDLGSGKSTTVGTLVIETMRRSDRCVSVLIPLKSLKITSRFTTDDLLQAIDKFIVQEAAPTVSEVSVKGLLEKNIEVLIVFDGLDELDQEVASRLLHQASVLPQHWPSIQVVATGRPIELIGVSYVNWGLAWAIPLDDKGKRQFIIEELLADGVSQSEVEARASSLVHTLKLFTSLDRLAETPLAVRLIYPRIKSIIGDPGDVTLGDLLYDVLLDRLGKWQQLDDKPKVLDDFEKLFPTPEAKASLLGYLSRAYSPKSKPTIDEAKERLRLRAANIQGLSQYLVAEQALKYFESSGLVVLTENIEFPMQPLWEIASAIGIVTEWLEQADKSPPPASEFWRFVSFAGTLSRRLGLLDRLREPIVKFIESILDPEKQSNVAAACYVVAEACDKQIAERTIARFAILESRPLSLFNDETEVSAHNVAKTIWLAGEAGFDWFYKEYLNPRYPLSNYGSFVIHRVLESWTVIVKGKLTQDQKNKLSSVVRPYLEAGEGHFFGILANLSLLVPSSFDEKDRYWSLCRLLEREPLGSLAIDELISAAHNGDQTLISSVLLAQASNYSKAALTWLKINGGQLPPIQIIEAALRSIAKGRDSLVSYELENECRSRLGEERWLRFARWVVCHDSSEASIGAAIVLYNAGERRITVLGKALLNGMHDGGYVPAAERVLQSLMKEESERISNWLAKEMIQNSYHYGAHSGHWRVLLSSIEDITKGSEMLASCMCALGPFTLPRYPEVREAFRRLMNGQRGREFREAFLARLHSFDPDTQRGISVTLISTEPNEFPEALIVAIQGRTNQRLRHDWREWEQFCLSLEFSASVLAFLKDRLAEISHGARPLALAILAKGKMPLDQKLKDELSRSLLSFENWHFDSEAIGTVALRSGNSLDLLLDLLQGTNSEKAERAASKLLELHSSNMTITQYARCVALVSKPRFDPSLLTYMLRIHEDHDFANAVIAATNELETQFGKQPLLKLVAAANIDESKWRDVVWALLCDDSWFGGSFEAEHGGEILLGYGSKVRAHARAIGQAAKEFLGDPRLLQNRFIEAHHWLALIADEFVQLPKEMIENAIKRGNGIYGAARASLVSRLGAPSTGTPLSRRARADTPRAISVPPISSKEETVGNLLEFSRASDTLHPRLYNEIENSLYLLEPLQNEIPEFARIATPGVLIALALRYCYGAEPRLNESIPLLDVSAFSQITQNQHDLKKLYRIWSIVRDSVLSYDEQKRIEYLASLDDALLDSKVWPLSIAHEILAIRSKLLPNQVEQVFLEYSRHTTWKHPELFIQLSLWLSGEFNDDEKAPIVDATKSALAILNQESWVMSDQPRSGPWAFLLFPLLLWRFIDEPTEESIAVFLRGIKFAIVGVQTTGKDSLFLFDDLLESLEPLLKRVSPIIIEKVVARGLQAFDPSVRAFSQLLYCLVQKSSH